MKVIKRFLNKINIILEFFQFLYHRRLWWLIPMIIILLGLGLLITLNQTVTFLPLIYPLF